MLGINLGRHDSGAAYLSINSKTDWSLEVYQLERLTKHKHDGNFPFLALKKFMIDHPEAFEKLRPEDVALNSFNLSPAAMEEVFSQSPLYREYLQSFGFEKLSTLCHPEIFQPGHHICHAYSAWGFSPFEKAMVIVFDGWGSKRHGFNDYFSESALGADGTEHEYETLSVYLLENGEITPVHKEWTSFIFPGPNDPKHMIGESLGNLFSHTAQVIFGSWMEAGKVMGLAAYGRPSPISSITEFSLNNARNPTRRYQGKDAFDHQPPEDFQRSADLAASAQAKFEEVFVNQCKDFKRQFPGFENLILVGGCALNCLTNSRLLKDKIFTNVFVPPFPNDEGIALGAALCHAHRQGKIAFRTVDIGAVNAYLGRTKSASISRGDIEAAFPGCTLRPWQEAAGLLAKGEVLAWFRGRSEVGPRALGNRSILVRPDRADITKYLNENIKFREDFRPYGASVLHADAHLYFEVEAGHSAPFMTFAPRIRKEKAACLKGVTHKDGTCRIQTVTQEQNPQYHGLLSLYKGLTGESVLLNTSLNIMGQPILEDLADAQQFLKTSKIKYMVINDFLVEKHEN